MSTLGRISRRAFLLGSVGIAGGVAFGYYRYRQPYPNPLLEFPLPDATALTPYVLIDAAGVTLVAPRAEMGQGVSTTLAALLAEELDLAWQDVRVMHGPAGHAYFNTAVLADALPVPSTVHGVLVDALRAGMAVPAKFIGLQVTGGSSSVPDAYMKLRIAGAAARHVLVQAAATRLGVAPASLRTSDGAVLAADGSRLPYSALAAEAATIALPESPTLKPRADWRLLGRSLPRLDMVAKCTGTEVYAIDKQLPGLRYANVRMSPVFGGELQALDDKAARGMRGVLAIERIPGGVAVVADNTWRAMQAAAALGCEWEKPRYPDSTDALVAAVKATLDADAYDSRFRDDGDVAQALADAPAETVLDVEYRVPFLAHATMEPMGAVGWLRDGQLELWAGVQTPTQARIDAAAAAGLAVADVRLHVLPMGGGFGRRSESDFIRQVALLAAKLPGTPIKLTWSRGEDTKHDMYRPAAIARLRGVARESRVTALDARVASQSVLESQATRLFGFAPPGPDKLIVDGLFDLPYTIDACRVTGCRVPPLLPVGFWRSVGNSFNAFFVESFVDELAVRDDIDPLALRLAMLEHAPSRAVLQAVADMCRWSEAPAPGRHRGLAFHLSFGVPVALVIEISSGDAGLRLEHAYVAADVGIALDPGNIEAQLQSGVMFGLTAAIHGEITFAGGEVEQSNFHQFRLLRFAAAPAITVRVLENGQHVRGIGEPGTPPAAPALANAVFRATGKRFRALPLGPHVHFAGDA